MPATSWRSSPPPRSTRSTSSRSAFGCGSAARMVPTLSSIARNCSIVIIVIAPPLSSPLPSLERGHRLERLRLEAGAHAGQVLVGELAHLVVQLRLLDGGECLALLALPALALPPARARRHGVRPEERRCHEERDGGDQREAEQVAGERHGSRSMSSSSRARRWGSSSAAGGAAAGGGPGARAPRPAAGVAPAPPHPEGAEGGTPPRPVEAPEGGARN